MKINDIRKFSTTVATSLILASAALSMPASADSGSLELGVPNASSQSSDLAIVPAQVTASDLTIKSLTGEKLYSSVDNSNRAIYNRVDDVDTEQALGTPLFVADNGVAPQQIDRLPIGFRLHNPGKYWEQ